MVIPVRHSRQGGGEGVSYDQCGKQWSGTACPSKKYRHPPFDVDKHDCGLMKYQSGRCECSCGSSKKMPTPVAESASRERTGLGADKRYNRVFLGSYPRAKRAVWNNALPNLRKR